MNIKSYVLTLCFSTLVMAAVFAARPKLPIMHQNGIKLNLLSPIYGNASITYQHLLNPYQSLQVNLGYMDFSDFTILNQHPDFRVQGLSISPEYRRNFTGYGLNGFYVGPFIRYMYYKRTMATEGNNSTSGALERFNEITHFNSLGLGLLVGQQYIIKNTILIDVFIGPSYQFLLSENKEKNAYQNYSTRSNLGYLGESVPDRYLNGYGIRAGFTIGLAF